MRASPLHGVLDHLRKWTDPARVRELNDADLLERFRLGREEAAFTLLVQRHGPMVLTLCRRILGDVHSAEDAFQATFLVLLQPAGLLAVLLIEATANAMVPSPLTLSTVRLGMQALQGNVRIPAPVALADNLTRRSIVAKWTAALTLLATIGFADALGHRQLAIPSPAGQDNTAPRRSAKENPGEGKFASAKPRGDWQGDPLADEAWARMGSSRLRHPSPRALAFSSDGKQIVSSAFEGLRVWDTASGKPVHRFDFQRGQNQTSCRYLGDRIICAIVGDKWLLTVQTIDPTTGQVRRRLAIKEPATANNPTLQAGPGSGPDTPTATGRAAR